MTDDAAKPDKTVMRPQAGDRPGPGAPPPPPGAPAVDNPDVPPPGAGDGSPSTVMVPPAPPALGGYGGGEPPAQPADAIDPEFPTRASKAGLTSAVVALGTGLLGAAVLIAAVKSRNADDGDLDWSNYGVGLGATAVLLVIALLGAAAARRKLGGRAREEAITWPGVVGILATAVMIDVGVDSGDRWLGYLTGVVIVVLAALGYLAARRAAFVVTAIVGLALIYGLAFDDLLAERLDDVSEPVLLAAVVGVFVVVVTLLGWLLPTRAVSGVAVGAFGLVSYVGILGALLATRYLSAFFGGMTSLEGGEEQGAESMLEMSDFAEADVWWILVFAAVLTLMWALAAAVSNHSGFSILAIAMATLQVPLAMLALAEEHPTYWSGALAAAGGLLLLGGVLLARLRGKKNVQTT